MYSTVAFANPVPQGHLAFMAGKISHVFEPCTWLYTPMKLVRVISAREDAFLGISIPIVNRRIDCLKFAVIGTCSCRNRQVIPDFPEKQGFDAGIVLLHKTERSMACEMLASRRKGKIGRLVKFLLEHRFADSWRSHAGFHARYIRRSGHGQWRPLEFLLSKEIQIGFQDSGHARH